MHSTDSADTLYAYFHVRGSFDPDEITRRVGITPTEIGREGEHPRSDTLAKRACSLWALHSRLGRKEDIESHVKDVLDQLDCNKTAFIELSRELGGTLEVVGYFRESEPGIHFDQRTVQRIAEYSLSIDCDFYK